MIETSVLEEYLKGLYEVYETLGTEYKNLHKRSRMHDMETAENYYRRWKAKLLTEIRRVEREHYELIIEQPLQPSTSF